ncbi:MAG: YncE family protein [Balneolaceae bacterium]
MKSLFLGGLLVLATALLMPLQAQTYTFYVAAESEDRVYRIAFDAETRTSTIENEIIVGVYPQEIEGPHGIGVDASGEYWFVSLGHGVPFGTLYKYETGTDRRVDSVELGLFPASLDISSETGWVYVVNFDLHGPHEPSTVSVVDGHTMEELDRIDTGIMPHGSRLSADQRYQYHVSMMTDELMEIDAFTLEMSRRLPLTDTPSSMHAGHHSHGHGQETAEPMQHATVSPTWASPHPFEPYVYIAGNRSNEILAVNRESWQVKHRWSTSARGPYNLEPTHSGDRLVVTYKGEGAVGFWDLETGTEIATLPTSRKVTHGVVISPDDRFAFVSVEGIGGEPGSVDIFDLETYELADVVEIGKQASGIAFWKMTP